MPLLALFTGLALGFSAQRQALCQPARTSDGLQLSAERRDDNRLIFDARLELGEPAAAFFEYGSQATGWFRTATSAPAVEHRLPIIRLRPDTTYQLRAFGLDGAGCPSLFAATEIISGDLPVQLRRISVEAQGHQSFQLAFMDVRVSQSSFRWLVAYDRDGQAVWYFPLSRETLGQSPGQHGAGIVRLANGNFVTLPGQANLALELSPDARPLRRIRLADTSIDSLHHDLLDLPDGRLLFIFSERRIIDDTVNGGPPDLRIRGDGLYLYDPDASTAQRAWSAFDALDPTERPEHWRDLHARTGLNDDTDWPNWNHTNAVSMGRRGNYLLTMRHMDQLISLSPDFATVEWRLGGPGSTFTFPDPSDRFWAPHAAYELPNGRLLLFDNGKFRPEGEYSRALELELDFSTMTARKVWEYRAEPDIEADRVSNAIRMPNGNTLVNFGFRFDDPAAPVVLVEARPDGTAAWTQSMTYPGGRISRYRVYPLESLGGEMPVEPTAVRLP